MNGVVLLYSPESACFAGALFGAQYSSASYATRVTSKDRIVNGRKAGAWTRVLRRVVRFSHEIPLWTTLRYYTRCATPRFDSSVSRLLNSGVSTTRCGFGVPEKRYVNCLHSSFSMARSEHCRRATLNAMYRPTAMSMLLDAYQV